jgi:hypothetical protein
VSLTTKLDGVEMFQGAKFSQRVSCLPVPHSEGILMQTLNGKCYLAEHMMTYCSERELPAGDAS